MKKSEKPEHKDYAVFVDNKIPSGMRKKMKMKLKKHSKEDLSKAHEHMRKHAG